MYLWNAHALAKELQERTLNEKQKSRYLLLILIILAISEVLCKSSTNNVEAITRFSSFIIKLIITILGFSYCFKMNQKGDKQNFMERFICLSVPITIQIITIMVIAALLIVIPFAFIPYWRNLDIMNVYPIQFYFLAIIGEIIFRSLYYYLLSRKIYLIAHKEL